MKRLLSVLLIISLILGCVSALAEESVVVQEKYQPKLIEENDYAGFVLSDGTIGISGYTGSEANLIIPDELNGKAVTKIMGGAFSNNQKLESVVIPAGITKIDGNPFWSCFNLSSIKVDDPESNFEFVDGAFFCKEPKRLITYLTTNEAETYTIPDGTCELEYYVFYGNQFLKTISIPDSVEAMDMNPFMGCVSLTTIKISPDNPKYAIMDGVMFRKEDKALIAYPSGLGSVSYHIPQGIKRIGAGAFSGAVNLKEIVLPDTVEDLEHDAFAACTGLVSVNIPESVKTIGDGAFSWCINLESITIPDSVTKIGMTAFAGSAALKSIVIPDSVTEIGIYAFADCDQLTITVSRDSYAAQYCRENNLNYTYPDANDWLNQ